MRQKNGICLLQVAQLSSIFKETWTAHSRSWTSELFDGVKNKCYSVLIFRKYFRIFWASKTSRPFLWLSFIFLPPTALIPREITTTWTIRRWPRYSSQIPTTTFVRTVFGYFPNKIKFLFNILLFNQILFQSPNIFHLHRIHVKQFAIFPPSFVMSSRPEGLDRRDEILNSHRRSFTPDEDRTLAALVSSKQSPRWLEISRQMPGRTARQCRDR
jgi:hypothetical protein